MKLRYRALAISFFLFLLCATAPCISQDRLWSVEISYDYMTHGDVFGSAVLYEDFSELLMNNNEKPTFYLALTHSSKLTRKLAIRYGLSFTDKGFTRDFTYINPNTSTGIFYRWEMNRNLYYLGIPVLLSFNSIIPNKKVSGYVEVGFVPEILLYNNANRETLPDRILEYDYKVTSISVMFSAGVQYKISPSIMLIAGPQVRKSLASYGEKIVPTGAYKPFSYGISVGTRFKL